MLRLVFFLFIATACHHATTSTQQLVNEKNKPVPDTTEIDVVKVSPDQCKVLLENEHVRVIRYSLKPGEKDTPHTHPPKTYYVVSGGKLRVYPENEKPFDAEEVEGTVEWSGYRGKHYVENIGTTTVTLVLTEVKAERRKHLNITP